MSGAIMATMPIVAGTITWPDEEVERNMTSLEDIALRLDEIAAEHPEIPDLADLHEKLTEHFSMHEKDEATINLLRDQVADLSRNMGRERNSYDEWARREERALRDDHILRSRMLTSSMLNPSFP